jgi:hypothetical protein
MRTSIALVLQIILRKGSLLLIPFGAVACASTAPGPSIEIEASLSRGGGLSGISETIRLWSEGGQVRGSLARSDENRPRRIRLPRRTLDSALVLIDSLIAAAPILPWDTGEVRMICGDAILTHIQVRRGDRIQSAQEECPHRTPASETYWRQVDGLFRFLTSAAR